MTVYSMIQDPHFWNGAAFLIAVLFLARPLYKALTGLLDAYSSEIQDDLDKAQAIFKEASEVYNKALINHRSVSLRVADIKRFSRINMEHQKQLHEDAMANMEKTCQQCLTLTLERMKLQAIDNLRTHLLSSALNQTSRYLQAAPETKILLSYAPHLFEKRSFSIDNETSTG